MECQGQKFVPTDRQYARSVITSQEGQMCLFPYYVIKSKIF